MTKLVLSISLLLLCAGMSAQIGFGPKAGLNLANWSTEGHNSLSFFHVGGVVNFPLGEKFSIQPEILYSGKGTDLSDFIPSNPMRFTMKYVSFPLMIGYQIGHVRIQAGAEYSTLVDSSIEINGTERDLPEAFDKSDWAIAAGASLDIYKGLSLQVRYCYGLVDVVEVFFVDANGQDLGTLNEGKNRVLQLGLAYLFNHK